MQCGFVLLTFPALVVFFRQAVLISMHSKNLPLILHAEEPKLSAISWGKKRESGRDEVDSTMLAKRKRRATVLFDQQLQGTDGTAMGDVPASTVPGETRVTFTDAGLGVLPPVTGKAEVNDAAVPCAVPPPRTPLEMVFVALHILRTEAGAPRERGTMLLRQAASAMLCNATAAAERYPPPGLNSIAALLAADDDFSDREGGDPMAATASAMPDGFGSSDVPGEQHGASRLLAFAAAHSASAREALLLAEAACDAHPTSVGAIGQLAWRLALFRPHLRDAQAHVAAGQRVAVLVHAVAAMLLAPSPLSAGHSLQKAASRVVALRTAAAAGLCGNWAQCAELAEGVLAASLLERAALLIAATAHAALGRRHRTHLRLRPAHGSRTDHSSIWPGPRA